MGFIREEKAQSTTEILIILAAIILLATLIGLFIKRRISQSAEGAQATQQDIEKGLE